MDYRTRSVIYELMLYHYDMLFHPLPVPQFTGRCTHRTHHGTQAEMPGRSDCQPSPAGETGVGKSVGIQQFLGSAGETFAVRGTRRTGRRPLNRLPGGGNLESAVEFHVRSQLLENGIAQGYHGESTVRRTGSDPIYYCAPTLSSA